MIQTIIAAVIVLSAIAAALSIIWNAIVYGVGPVPSKAKAKAAIITILKSRACDAQICECGAGWGTLAFAAANACPHAKVTAYEISPVPCMFLKIRAKITRCNNIKIFCENFYQADFSDYRCIISYLHPHAMEKLRLKVEKESARGTIVISNTFALNGWTPQQSIELKDLYRTKLYLYEVDKAK